MHNVCTYVHVCSGYSIQLQPPSLLLPPPSLLLPPSASSLPPSTSSLLPPASSLPLPLCLLPPSASSLPLPLPSLYLLPPTTSSLPLPPPSLCCRGRVLLTSCWAPSTAPLWRSTAGTWPSSSCRDAATSPWERSAGAEESVFFACFYTILYHLTNSVVITCTCIHVLYHLQTQVSNLLSDLFDVLIKHKVYTCTCIRMFDLCSIIIIMLLVWLCLVMTPCTK